MVVVVKNKSLKHELENLARVFYPFEKIRITDEIEQDEKLIVCCDDGNNLSVKASIDGKAAEKKMVLTDEKLGDAMSVLMYNALAEITDYKPQWGILTGVRPAKLMHRICDTLSKEDAKQDFESRLLVSSKKAELAQNVMENENKIISLSKNNSFSLYVSIPFCPSRCSYCSFVSHSIKQAKKLIEPYVQLLQKEIAETGKIAKELGLRLETIYFGGGTPTTLSASQLETLFIAVRDNFDLSNLCEYTVEAGRPDTITKEKLEVIKKYGITRISINPQSFNNEVLDAIGRKHTGEDVVNAFKLARECNFDNINMDFIAGLPKENLDSFKYNIDKAVELGAESITVHTLAMKTASYMAQSDDEKTNNRELTNDMVDYSNEKLSKNGYYPYYMYRQSKTVGNLENVGWCKENKDCLYNVFMMDETHSVFAVGGGAVTKLRQYNGSYIERIYNFKYPYEYIDRFDELIERKKRINSFYNEYN